MNPPKSESDVLSVTESQENIGARSVVANQAEIAKPKNLFPIFNKDFRCKTDPLKSIQLSIKKSSNTPRRRILLSSKEPPGLTQSVLDAGQKKLGPIFCDECGLLYSPGDYDDEKIHKKAHQKLDNLYSIKLWKNAQVVFSFSDGCFIVMLEPKKEAKVAMNRLKDFLAWLDSELGVGYESSGSSPDEKIFLYMSPTKRKNMVRIMGVVVTEMTKKENILVSPIASKSDEVKTTAPTAPIVIGITRLWTDVSFRRKKVASKLCDKVRFHSGIPGFIVPKNQMAILEPSEDGRAFMDKFTNGLGYMYTLK